MSHLGPPEELPPIGKLLYVVTFTIGMALFAYFVVPLIYQYVSIPLGDWVYEIARSWTGEPYKPR